MIPRSERLKRLVVSLNRRLGPWLAIGGGIATALLWRKGIDAVRASFVLASLFAAVTLLALFPPWGDARPTEGRGALLHGAAWWTAVNLAQGALWFVLPFYVVSTTWLSWNAPFTLLLSALAVVSCFDVFMRDRVLGHGHVAAAFMAPAAFAALQLFLPVLTSVPPRLTCFAAGALAAAAGAWLVLPGRVGRVGRVGRAGRVRAAATLLGAAVAGAGLARAALPWIAPAPLRLASGTFALGRQELDPVDPVRTLPAGDGRHAFVFVAVEAPRGLVETVHLSVEGAGEREGRPLAIAGGRKGGYRLWAEVSPTSPGRVRATVVTEGGQIVGRVEAPAEAAGRPEARAGGR